MKKYANNAFFWQKVDTLYSSGDFKIVCRKGSSHKVYPSLTYPCDFGYIETLSNDADTSMEVFRSAKSDTVDAIVVCADIINKRFEVKALVGLNEEECLEVLHFLNCTDYQKSVLLRRGKEIPFWSETE